MYRVSKRKKAFIYYKARGYNNADSIIKAGYKVKNRMSAYALGFKYAQKVEIKKLIETEKVKVYEKNRVTEDYIIDLLDDIARNGKVEANRVRATELLGKTKAMFTDKLESKTTISMEEELDLRKLANNYTQDIVSRREN
ncbi:MAG: terminase small subunit [Bacteroidetes bacterium]|nr:terminase small subunit [Bacteroidota bacterium]